MTIHILHTYYVSGDYEVATRLQPCLQASATATDVSTNCSQEEIVIDKDNHGYDDNIRNTASMNRRSFEPRYVSKILPTDFATPRRKKRTIKMIIDSDKRQRIKIKRLQNLNFKHKEKIRSLTDLVKHLRKGDILSREAGDSLLVK